MTCAAFFDKSGSFPGTRIALIKTVRVSFPHNPTQLSSTHSGSPFQAHYVAAKSAVNGLTKTLALEYGPHGITANVVPPGFIDTPMLRKAEREGLLGGSIQDNISKVPVGRVGMPEDIAATCAFLVSEEAGYITGQIVGVNGGRCT